MAVILALDCSTEYCSVALSGAGEYIVRDVHALQAHAEQVLLLTSECLGAAGFALADCDAIAFAAGPGSFTGLRIACAVAQGLAFGAECPVLAIPTLAAMAEAARARQLAPAAALDVLVAQDARMGEVYWSIESWDGGSWRTREGARLALPDEVSIPGGVRLALGCGSAFERFAQALAPCVERVEALDHPGGSALLRMAEAAWARGEAQAAAQARPLYVRDRVALTTEERARRAVAS